MSVERAHTLPPFSLYPSGWPTRFVVADVGYIDGVSSPFGRRVPIGELTEALASGAEDARSLSRALAGIAPHVEGDLCPVCDRTFAEQGVGSPATHIAAKIAALTTEAGRLQALSTERAEESNRLSVAQRDLESFISGQLS